MTDKQLTIFNKTRPDQALDSFSEKRDQFVENCYIKYPRKMGKGRGSRSARNKLTSEKKCREFWQALVNFLDYHKAQATQKIFMPYWSTFVNQYTDWLDEDVGKSEDMQADDMFDF